MVVAALVVGVVVGALVGWLLWRSRAEVRSADEAAAVDRLRFAEAQALAEAERARAEASGVRAQLAGAATAVAEAQGRVHEARAEAALARQEAAEARADAADAHAETAAALARVATHEARAVAALAERDAAVSRATEIASDRDALAKEFKVLSTATLDEQSRKADASADQRLKATELLMTPVKESLERFNQRLAEVEKERVAMQTDLRNQVAAVRVTGDELRRETNALSTALRKPQVRGAWGEMQLKRVAEVAGMLERCDFALQQTASTSEDRTIRPDMKVMLAEGKFVYVDAKVPLTSFLDAQTATDETEQQRLLQSFAKNVRSHIDQLSGKAYFKADTSTPEFVVLFMPSEALAAEALSQLPDLHEYAARKSIVLATPTTLIAMLRAIAYSWQQAALADSAAEVFALGRELYDRLGTMGGHFDRIGRSLASTVRAYNDALGSLESRVMVTARRFRDLSVTDKELGALTAIEAPARNVTTPELIEDAARATPMIGRGLPEMDELVRPEPTLDEVAEATTVTPLPNKGRMAR